MAISGSCKAAVRVRAKLVALLFGLVLAGCATMPPPDAAAPPPLDVAVLALADALLLRAGRPAGTLEGPRALVIDRATGTETATTRAMSRRIAARVEERHPSYVLQPFTPASLEARPLVLLGAITGGSLTNSAATPGACRIWAVLADLRSGTVVAHETAWVRPEEIDQTPTAFHRDSPGWLPDPAAAA